ncbi:hypothetical protein Q3G72_016717 [Acer saccharum]|nr:hypothetical protein Q3G72_016717 [Acer saccharum]
MFMLCAPLYMLVRLSGWLNLKSCVQTRNLVLEFLREAIDLADFEPAFAVLSVYDVALGLDGSVGVGSVPKNHLGQP